MEITLSLFCVLCVGAIIFLYEKMKNISSEIKSIKTALRAVNIEREEMWNELTFLKNSERKPAFTEEEKRRMEDMIAESIEKKFDVGLQNIMNFDPFSIRGGK